MPPNHPPNTPTLTPQLNLRGHQTILPCLTHFDDVRQPWLSGKPRRHLRLDTTTKPTQAGREGRETERQRGREAERQKDREGGMEGGREGGRERSTEAGRRGGNSQKDGREAAPAPSAASAAPVTDTRREGERLETQQPDRTACCGVRRRRPVTPKRHGQFRLSK